MVSPATEACARAVTSNDDDPGTPDSQDVRATLGRIVRRTVLSLVSVAFAMSAWSFGHALLAANGDPLSVKATEWARDHGLGWIVDRAEHAWYARHQPPIGGTPRGGIARVAPRVVVAPAPARARGATAVPAAPCPQPLAPLARVPLPGEGAWRSEGRVPGSICFSYLRPDAIHTSIIVGVAWMNMSTLRATLHNGTALPGGGPWQAGPFIAATDYPRVVAAFNSGFRLDASRGGYFTEGRVVQPLVNARASLVVFADGHVDVGSWGRDDAMTGTVVSVRQNLDLLVDNHQVAAGVSDARSNAWGATLGDRIYTWRSGIGIDDHHDLVYVGGPGLDVATLATILQRAGCVRAMELDINPEWVSLMTYAPSTANGLVATKLLANMERPADRYLHPGTRDFVELDARQ